MEVPVDDLPPPSGDLGFDIFLRERWLRVKDISADERRKLFDDSVALAAEMKPWVQLAKMQKSVYVRLTERGDIPPTVIAVRNGEVLAIVTAQDVDKHQGLHAAHVLRCGLAADQIVLIVDAHVASSRGESEEEFRKKWPAGSMQKACDEEGACALGEISDCLIAHCTSKDRMVMANVPYSYHGRGTPFRWVRDSDIGYLAQGGVGVTSGRVEGLLADALRHSFASADAVAHPLLDLVARQYPDDSPDKRQYHVGRASLKILIESGYMVMANPAFGGDVGLPLTELGNRVNLLTPKQRAARRKAGRR